MTIPNFFTRWPILGEGFHIGMLEVDGVTYEDESEMADQAVQFYKKLYKETEEWRLCVEGLEFDQIEGLERDWLERRFEKEEIL